MDEEEQKLLEAWDKFQKKVVERLRSKHHKGYRGWDGQYPMSSIITELAFDVREVRYDQSSSRTLTAERYSELCFDIAARIMFIESRRGTPTT